MPGGNRLSREKKQFINAAHVWANAKFGGMGDPEIEDAVDVVGHTFHTDVQWPA